MSIEWKNCGRCKGSGVIFYGGRLVKCPAGCERGKVRVPG